MEKTKNKLLTNSVFVGIMALFCCALWGSATPFIKLGYELMLPERSTPSIMLFAGIRFTLAGILVVIIYSLARRKFLIPKKENWGKVATISAFQTVIQYIFFYIGLANTSGVKGTVASSSSAFFALLVASLMFRQEKLTFKKILAMVIGFSGIILINLNGLDFNMNFTGDCFVIFSAAASGISSVLVKIFSKDEDAVILSGYQFIMGGIVLMIVGASFGGFVVISGIKALSVLIYLAFLSAAAYSIWGVLLSHNPVSKVTFYSFTTPILGVLLTMLILSENPNTSPLNILIALVLMSIGISILNYKKE